MPRPLLTALLVSATVLTGCEVGPNYKRPSAPTPASNQYREIQGWTPADPNADAVVKTDWWTLFDDPVLNDLEQRVVVNNQTLAADLAAYQQARAILSEQEAALWPTLSGTGDSRVTFSSGGRTVGASGVVLGSAGAARPIPIYTMELGATWEPDLWGRVRRLIENARANAQANLALLNNARLSAQMELAADYIALRQLDEEKRIDDATVKAYETSLTITRNKFLAGNAAQSDVDQAETQLTSERAAATALGQQRAQMEDAIAVLIGRPADLSIPPAPWTLKPVDVPPGLPSTLLQRRPDVAAAERQAAAASAEIGVATAGFFPSVTLTGAGGTETQAISHLFNPQTFFWNAGASAVETVFNAGLTVAQVRAARAFYNEAVANYRQTALTAFGQVEDNLAAQRVLAAEQPDLQASVRSADDAVRVTLNE